MLSSRIHCPYAGTGFVILHHAGQRIVDFMKSGIEVCQITLLELDSFTHLSKSNA
jgi:hypothetical protein